MTEKQWAILLDVINGKESEPMPVGFIIDSPWLPGWAKMTTMDYFSSDNKWLEANIKAIREFPDVIFLPGFWSEFGMGLLLTAWGGCSKI